MGGPRWMMREQWHLTVQFLGNVDDVDAIAGALIAVGRAPAARMQLGGSGAFPNPRRARVVWMGVAQGIEGLAAIARAVGEVLTPIGYAPEDRPFRAHLTVARLGRPADVTPALAALGDDLVGGVWAAAEVVLYQSRLTRSGAEYTALARIPLRGSRAS